MAATANIEASTGFIHPRCLLTGDTQRPLTLSGCTFYSFLINFNIAQVWACGGETHDVQPD
ncbi:hypothetical protein GCM10007391_32610 [Alteromonas halophila]|uniref:Uncharacterized protein n=1 Tax=Alteromonas halophila TaxID=516698 RepID=A0A918N1T9_9ALTE|nr:hypothetical protein GCM10007391_32610 [Alteromonas halophila]